MVPNYSSISAEAGESASVAVIESADELPQINPSDEKSNQNQTESGHFFHQTGLK
jgi:hypothetical protein